MFCNACGQHVPELSAHRALAIRSAPARISPGPLRLSVWRAVRDCRRFGPLVQD
jgi:hypothetical protein